jgi:hypothetical protein
MMITRAYRFALIATALLALSAPPSRTATEEVVKRSPEIEKLKFLEGNWTYEVVVDQGIVNPSVVLAKTVGTRKTIEGPGGFSLISDFTEHAANGDTVGHEVTLWDADSNEYKSYVFSSSSPGVEVRTGSWIDGKLVFEYDYVMGMPMRSITAVNANGTVTTFHNNKSRRGPLVFTVNAKRISDK